MGKWNSMLGNVMVIDSKYFMNVVVQNLQSNLARMADLYVLMKSRL